MTIEVQVVNERKNPVINKFAMEKMRRVVRRFDQRMSSLALHIGTQSEAKKALEVSCTIDANLIKHGRVHVDASEPNAYMAIKRAVRRFERAVAKRLDHNTHNALHNDLAMAERSHDEEVFLS